MNLEQNMASLVIKEKKKRRLSGLFKPLKIDLDLHSSTPDCGEGEDQDPVIADEEPSASSSQPRRSLRKKIRTDPPENRRTVTRPKRSADEIENYYLDKRVKRLPPSLETIFEEPQIVKSQELVMSARKFRRVINFDNTTAKNATKIKKRKLKAKTVSSKKRVMRKVSLEMLIKKLSGLDEEGE